MLPVSDLLAYGQTSTVRTALRVLQGVMAALLMLSEHDALSLHACQHLLSWLNT